MPFFQTKLRPEDFVVTELLEQQPSGKGDYHYVLIEKKGLTTFLLLDLLVKDFALNRNMIGIAGLKDKHAVTRQWLSILKRDVAKHIGGINDLLAWMRKKGKVINATYGQKMLKLGDNAGNHFDIVLVPSKKPTEAVKTTVATFFAEIETVGVPNYFGDQRFGHGGNNRKIGYDLLSGNIRNIKGDKNTMAEKRFKVQAFASYVFNRYLDERIKRGLLHEIIPGDIKSRGDEIVTGPMPGDDLKIASGAAGELERKVFAAVGLKDDIMKRFAQYSLFGIRRNILLYPRNVTFVWKGQNLYVSFDLPSGAYATVVIDELEKRLRQYAITGDQHSNDVVSRTKRYETTEHSSQARNKTNPTTADSKKDPTINPYTGQKLNTDKAKTKSFRQQKKGEKNQRSVRKK